MILNDSKLFLKFGTRHDSWILQAILTIGHDLSLCDNMHLERIKIEIPLENQIMQMWDTSRVLGKTFWKKVVDI